ncbi:competence type IV pilus minor pilin ComGF [Staphylococcus chromogenes]|uniref:competence type IV pilus minor pilin ComGF n=1 Tax=Staphylococcus chromogenes TaxID=46126 RepID=UPI00227A0655|nr:competence type IV pilus minor pilin ComGF [Staphylococcus chromogenes]WAG29619.1 hypothetical protein LGV34_05740 [Staphylococcus chromogenes]
MKFIQQSSNSVFKIKKTIKNIVAQKKGFTLIETTIGFMIQSILIAIIPILFYVLIQFKSLVIYDDTYTFELMVKELSDSIGKAQLSQIKVEHHKITLPLQHETITYAYDNQKLIKTVNGKGNITVLHQVSKAKFKKVYKHHLLMNIKYKVGKEWRSHEVLF